MKLAIDPFIKFGITSTRFDRLDFSNAGGGEDGDCLMLFLTLVLGTENNGKEKEEVCQGFINSMGAIEGAADLFRNALDKDPDCGVLPSTFNKVCPKEYKIKTDICMLCKPTENLKNLKYPAYVSTKLDGVRCIMHLDLDNRAGQVLSRNGKPYKNFDEYKNKIIEAAVRVGLTGKLMVDGEMIDERGLEQTMTQTQRKENVDTSNMVYYMFDAVKDDRFEEPIEDRLKILWNIIDYLHSNKKTGIALVHHVKVEDESKVWELHDYYVNTGHEGAVAKSFGSPYEFKKSKHWVKVKKFDDMDLTVIGFTDHSEKSGQIGALVVDYEGKELNVGSGYTDEQRIQFYGPHIVGKTIQVQYQKKSKNTLQFPVFKCVREDK